MRGNAFLLAEACQGMCPSCAEIDTLPTLLEKGLGSQSRARVAEQLILGGLQLCNACFVAPNVGQRVRQLLDLFDPIRR